MRGLNFWHIVYCQFNEIRQKLTTCTLKLDNSKLIYLFFASSLWWMVELKLSHFLSIFVLDVSKEVN